MEQMRLPRHLTPFIGRERDRIEIQSRITNPDCRLLTLVGPGGTGKTRLAVHVAEAVAGYFEDGVYFVNLQPIQSPDQVISAFADALDVTFTGQSDPEDDLLPYLQHKHMLLIVDNFEHVLEQDSFLLRITQNAPNVQVLVTSREALNLREEWLYWVEGLALPRSYQTDDVAAYAAVQLFVECAQKVRSDFSLQDERAGVVRICQLVEGSPLAIEIAASWVKTLRCSEIAGEIQRNLNFLTSNLRNVSERHRSMRAVFAQTWARLTVEEQAAFKKLSVFRGGFERAAAATVAGASLPMLSSLLDKCLIRREQDGRYQMHELLRQYAEEHLRAGEAAALAEAHCDYYTEFLAQRKAAINEHKQLEASTEIGRELENICAAWQHAVDNRRVGAIEAAATAYFYYCQMRSRFLEFARAAEEAASVLEELGEQALLAQLLVYFGWMLIRIGNFKQAGEVIARSRTLFEELQLVPAYGMGSHPLTPLIIFKVVQGSYDEAVDFGERCRQQSAALGDTHNECFACYGLTSAYMSRGDYARAQQNAQQAVALAEQIGNRWFMTYCLNEWGNVAQIMGNYNEAEKHYRAGLRIREEFNDPEGIAVVSNRLGEIALAKQDYETASHLFEQSLSIYQQHNDRGGLAASHHGLGKMALYTGSLQQAAQYFRAALNIAAEIQFVPLIVSILQDIAQLMMANNQGQRAADVLQATLAHPVSNAHQRRRAEELLATIPMPAEQPPLSLNVLLPLLTTELDAFQEQAAPNGHQSLADPLTPREIEVLRLMAMGLSNPAIADRLIVSIGTVKAHTSRIYGKLGVDNRTGAVVKARELSLLES